MSSIKKISELGGLTAIIVGLLLYLLSRDVDGFVGGMGQGAAVALLLGGVIGLSAAFRNKPNERTWLPSRDGDR